MININGYVNIIKDKIPKAPRIISLGRFFVIFDPKNLEYLKRRYNLSWDLMSGVLAKYRPEYIKEYINKRLDWNIVGKVLATYHPEYLSIVQDKFNFVSWRFVGVSLSEYNPEYLSQYADKFPNWNYLACNLARSFPEYLQEFKDRFDWKDVEYSLVYHHPDWYRHYVNKGYLEKY